MIIGLNLARDERAIANAWFQSIEPSERRRLAQLFLQMLVSEPTLESRSWADEEPDGSRKAPKAQAATNGNY